MNYTKGVLSLIVSLMGTKSSVVTPHSGKNLVSNDYVICAAGSAVLWVDPSTMSITTLK